MAANVRIQPGFSTKAYVNVAGIWQTPPGRLGSGGETVYAGLATVTAVVHVVGSADNYLLTVGHAFYDVDVNRSTVLQAGNNIVGSPPAPPIHGMIRAANQPEIRWGEGRIPGGLGPYAISAGLYYCAGDKLNSSCDAGLAKIDAGVQFNRTLRGSPINALDPHWPVQLPAGQNFMLGNIPRPNLESVLAFNPVWGGRAAGQLRNILRCVYSLDASQAGPGMSGMPLVRQNANGTVDIIAIFLGRASDANHQNGASPDYEIYQHISVAMQQLHITGLA